MDKPKPKRKQKRKQKTKTKLKQKHKQTTLQIGFKFTKGTKLTRVQTNSYTGLQDPPINMHIGGQEQSAHAWCWASRNSTAASAEESHKRITPNSQNVWIKNRVEASLKCEGSAHYSVNQILTWQE